MNSILMDGPSGNSSCGSTSMKVASCAINTDGALVFASLTSRQNQSTYQDQSVSPSASAYEMLQESGAEMDGWQGDDYGDDHDDDDMPHEYDGQSARDECDGLQVGDGLVGRPPTDSTRRAPLAAAPRNPLALLDPYDSSAAELSRDVRRNKKASKSSILLLKKCSSQCRKDVVLARYVETAKQRPEHLMMCARDICELLVKNPSSRSIRSHLSLNCQFKGILKRRKRRGYYHPSAARDEDAERAAGSAGGGHDEWMMYAAGGEDDYGEPDDFDNDIGYDHADDVSEGSVEELLTEEQLLSRRVEGVLREAGLSCTGDVLDVGERSHSGLNYTNTFENLCRQHIKNFMRGAETYARETNLSKRVSEWTSRLEPILLDQEQRPEFDIHAYSDKALEKVALRSKELVLEKSSSKDENGPAQVHFSDVVKGESSFEVGRIFLACLQLANLGNLTFSQTRGSIADFDVGLLNESSNRLQIDSYQTSSIDL
jgi:hypothetical protein